MSETLIQLFAKSPVPGKVKTRLIPDIGITSATAVFRYCLETNLNLIKHSSFDYQVWLTETSDDPLFANYPIHIQQGKSLGERMYQAISSQLNNNYDKVILMGSDCLDFTQELFNKVTDKLDHHDLVFIPALDGGYVLIAARNHITPEIFTSIAWGTDRVLLQCLEKAMSCGINTVILNPLRDLDRVEDIQHYAALKQFIFTD